MVVVFPGLMPRTFVHQLCGRWFAVRFGPKKYKTPVNKITDACAVRYFLIVASISALRLSQIYAEMKFIQRRIMPALRPQSIVIALLDNAPLFHHNDPVRGFDR